MISRSNYRFDLSKLENDLINKGDILELKELCNLFDSGALKSAMVTPAALSKGWEVIVVDGKKKQIMLTGQRTGDEPRVFKSIDAAVLTLIKMGFRDVAVKVSISYCA